QTDKHQLRLQRQQSRSDQSGEKQKEIAGQRPHLRQSRESLLETGQLEKNRIRWCGRRDSNSHTSRRQNLNLVCLPIPPRPPIWCRYKNARRRLAFLLKMGWTMGIEPTTPGATILCSTN